MIAEQTTPQNDQHTFEHPFVAHRDVNITCVEKWRRLTPFTFLDTKPTQYMLDLTQVLNEIIVGES